MNKEIQKNREALIRYFLSRDEQQRSPIDCAKCAALEGLGFEAFEVINFTGNRQMPEEAEQAIKMLGMSEQQWHEMENYFEGWTHYSSSAPDGGATFKQTALNYLQSLPGWPTVL